MPEEAPPKSAFELAMERLHAQDREAGIEAKRPLTGREKSRIAEQRRRAKAKLAELEILYRRDRRAAETDPEKLQEIEERYRTDRARVESRVETEIARIKNRSAD